MPYLCAVMLDKLELIYFRYKDLESQLGDPGVVGDMQKFKKTSKEYKDLEPISIKYLEYKNLLSNIDLNKKNELKRINSIDFKIGKLILKPFRFIKKSFK